VKNKLKRWIAGMGRDPDARGVMCGYAVGNGNLSCGPAAKEDKMGLTEVAVMTTVFATLAILRFGVPLAITWMVGKVAHHFEHAA
jgi:hypothetical protein